MQNNKTKVKGIVTGIESYGIFVKIDDNCSGLIHISEISEKFVKNPEDFAKVGEEIEAEIIENNEDGTMKLSIKNLNNAPKRKRKIIETSLGFKTLGYKLQYWIDENLKKHKNN